MYKTKSTPKKTVPSIKTFASDYIKLAKVIDNLKLSKLEYFTKCCCIERSLVVVQNQLCFYLLDATIIKLKKDIGTWCLSSKYKTCLLKKEIIAKLLYLFDYVYAGLEGRHTCC